MKSTLVAILLLSLAGAGVARSQQAASADTLVWCGLDYSKVKMIGTMDFRKPGEIFPTRLADWNSLFMKEMLPELEAMAKSVRTDLGAVQARNEMVAKQGEHSGNSN